MTKEEAINVLLDYQQYHIYRDMIGECKDNLAKAIDVAIDTLRETSLPTDIDEVVEEEFNNIWDSDLSGERDTAVAKKIARHFFEFGAERMAEQGVKATASVGYYNQCGLSILTEPSIKKLGFKEGDEVEIVIRKK